MHAFEISRETYASVQFKDANLLIDTKVQKDFT